MSKQNVLPAVEAKLTSERPGKPPLKRLQLDLVLRNLEAEPRWFLLPKSNLPRSGGVDTVEVYALTGHGRVVIGRFLGNGGFQALLLPAEAEVRLHKFPLSYWGELPEKILPLEVTIAKDFTVAGKPAHNWLGATPISDPHADVSDEQAQALSSQPIAGGEEAPVTISGGHSVQVHVDLS